MGKIAFLQIGKKGITDNFIGTLENHFEKHRTIRISVLKSARGEGAEGKKIVKKFADEILKRLGQNYKSKIIGFVIIIRKFKKTF